MLPCVAPTPTHPLLPYTNKRGNKPPTLYELFTGWHSVHVVAQQPRWYYHAARRYLSTFDCVSTFLGAGANAQEAQEAILGSSSSSGLVHSGTPCLLQGADSPGHSSGQVSSWQAQARLLPVVAAVLLLPGGLDQGTCGHGGGAAPLSILCVDVCPVADEGVDVVLQVALAGNVQRRQAGALRAALRADGVDVACRGGIKSCSDELRGYLEAAGARLAVASWSEAAACMRSGQVGHAAMAVQCSLGGISQRSRWAGRHAPTPAHIHTGTLQQPAPPPPPVQHCAVAHRQQDQAGQQCGSRIRQSSTVAGSPGAHLQPVP